MPVPTDDPAPRTRPRRPTADAELTRPAAAANGEQANGEHANGDAPEPRSPRPTPRVETSGEHDLDDVLGSDPRIDEFFQALPAAPARVDKRARLPRGRRKTGTVTPVVSAAPAALIGPVVPVSDPITADAVTAAEVPFVVPHGRRAQRRSRRQRARKVHRLVRHIEPWSVLKLALVFYFCLWVIMLVAGTILWRVAVSSGVIDNIEGFIESLLVLDNFKFNGDELFRAYAVGGLLMVLVATGFTVLATVLFNLISDLIGGVRVTVIQEETARPLEPRP